MRHPLEGPFAEDAAASRVPVINGGDGANEHSSQALLDLYTVRRELHARGRGIDGLRIAVVGDLRYGRAVHSLLKLLALFDRVSVHLVSPPGLEAPADVVAVLVDGGYAVEVYHNLGDGGRTLLQAQRLDGVEHPLLLRSDGNADDADDVPLAWETAV